MITLLKALAMLPLPVLHALGTAVGWLVYVFSPRFRGYLRANLAAAGYRDPALLRAAIAESGKGVVELPAIWLQSHERAMARVVQSEGWDIVESARARGKGVILLTPHLGCWEIAGQVGGRSDPLTVLYSPPKLAWLEPLMREGRDRAMVRSVPADLSGVRAMLRALHRNEAIGILPDQVPGAGEGEWAEFFGRPAYTMTLVARLAQKTGAPVVFGWAERLPRGRGYRVRIVPLPEALPGESAVRHVNRGIEMLIRSCPAQYLWAYNRYKVPAGVENPQ